MKTQPFPVPAKLEPELADLQRYWNGLKRGQAEMPFTDDVKLTRAPHPLWTMLLDVLKQPVRFRFALVGDEIRRSYGSDLAGLVADEIEVRSPLNFFISQCSAAVESRASTYYAHDDFARLVLPLWGDAHTNGLLIGIAARK
jgi:hypothetical protein